MTRKQQPARNKQGRYFVATIFNFVGALGRVRMHTPTYLATMHLRLWRAAGCSGTGGGGGQKRLLIPFLPCAAPQLHGGQKQPCGVLGSHELEGLSTMVYVMSTPLV